MTIYDHPAERYVQWQAAMARERRRQLRLLTRTVCHRARVLKQAGPLTELLLRDNPLIAMWSQEAIAALAEQLVARGLR